MEDSPLPRLSPVGLLAIPFAVASRPALAVPSGLPVPPALAFPSGVSIPPGLAFGRVDPAGGLAVFPTLLARFASAVWLRSPDTLRLPRRLT